MAWKDNPDEKVGEAFLVWLEQSPEWEAGLPATRLLTPADEAEVRSVAKEVMESFGSFPVRPPQDVMDTAISSFAWDWVRLNQRREGQKQSYTSKVEKVGGNARLAYVLVSTLEQGGRFVWGPSLFYGAAEGGWSLEGDAAGSRRVIVDDRTDVWQDRFDRDE
jgi:hypothetical protein